MNIKPLRIKSLTPKKFQKKVLSWFDSHGRKALPWQINKTAYRVWISEIMLQQTQVNTVIPFYERFMTQFPDLKTLAQASEDSVLHQWTGLGYYSRARNLHRTAKAVMALPESIFPGDLVTLQTLPGIGRSTAGAIRAIAFEKKAAILDGNVKRVLVRLYGVREWSGEKKTSERLWELAESLTPDERIADYTQAMMDLGATICVRGMPKCQSCPFEKECVTNRLGLTKLLPLKKPAVVMPVRAVTMLVLQNKGSILLEKRSAKGVWGGLWSLPEISDIATENEIRLRCQKLRFTALEINFGSAFRHTFSHYHLDITPAYVNVSTPRKIMEANQQIWYNLQQPASVGLPAPVKNLLRTMAPCPA